MHSLKKGFLKNLNKKLLTQIKTKIKLIALLQVIFFYYYCKNDNKEKHFRSFFLKGKVLKFSLVGN